MREEGADSPPKEFKKMGENWENLVSITKDAIIKTKKEEQNCPKVQNKGYETQKRIEFGGTG